MVQDADNDLQNLIDGLRADLGEKGTETTAFAAIQANAADISTINQNIGTINSKIGEVSTEKSLASQISEINSNLLSYAKSSELDAYVKLAAMSDYVTNKGLDDKNYIAADDVADNYLTIQSAEQTYETKTTVSGISKTVDTIEGDVKTLKDGFVALGLPGDFSDKVEEGSTILESIFEKLSELEKAIADVNKRIDELHPDSNSPSGDDNGNPEDDPSLDPSDPEEDPNLNEPDNDPEQSEPGSEPIE